MAPEAKQRVPFSPKGVQNAMDPKSQRATIVLLYVCLIVIPLLKVLLSSSNNNYDEYA